MHFFVMEIFLHWSAVYSLCGFCKAAGQMNDVHPFAGFNVSDRVCPGGISSSAHARTVEELPAEDAYRPKQIVRLSDAPLQVMSRSDSRAENFGKRRATSSSSSSSSSSP